MKNSSILTRLDNGLTVHLKEIHAAPIISHWVWYRVGSRNEKPGITGISHWVEHMQFKGTPKFPASKLDKQISRLGGMWNALTYMDWTTYFETLPAASIDLALDLEADRMINSIYDPEEVASERTVIISEREGSENDPMFILSEAIEKAAFQVHPYGNDVVGTKADLLSMTRDDLYQHYQAYYAPNNAIVAIAGDFQADEMLEKVVSYYGSLPQKAVPVLALPEEPPLTDERRVQVSGPGETTYVQICYPSPRADSEDFFIWSVLDSFLCGASSLNMFGSGGTTNKTSQLYRDLVETEKVVAVHGGLSASIDPHLYNVTMTVHPNSSAAQAIQAYDDSLARLLEKKIAQADIDRAIKQAKALFVFGSENITNQAFWLGYAEIFARYAWFENYVERLSRVTLADLQALMENVFTRNKRIVGIYSPAHGVD